MNNLPKYDKKNIEKNIKFFQQILLKQKQLSNIIDNNAKNKINQTKSYIKELTPIIDQKLLLLHNLDQQIRSVVKRNQNNINNDLIYKKFLESDKCKHFYQKIHEIDTTIVELKKFIKYENIE